MGQGATFSDKFGDELEAENEARAALRTLSDEELNERFGLLYYPTEERSEENKVHEHFRQLAWYIDATVPPGRAKAVALTELEGALHWAIKAVRQALMKEEPLAGT